MRFWRKKPPTEGGEKAVCENCERLKKELWLVQRNNDMLLSRRIKRDTDIINGLLREIDALHLLLEKQSQDGNNEGEDSCERIYNCQDMNF